ncbi:hypothetical protein F4560_002930 [Saccharothrix ecbatanensis]|uniref:Secreted protein n=2 Tax=Saccharothrix ecbatanensis TaxID=1105145 RepID=A0A7W9HIY7_9PSEU|nr:hypothetical protein [Saccharothrix ecbatanensis]
MPGITARLAAVLPLVVAATAVAGGTAAADGHCTDIGNGTVCMSVDDTGEPGEPTEVVSMWYEKHFGDPATVRFFYQPRNFPPEVRSDWRTIAAGEVTSWRELRTGSDCYGGGLEVQGGPEFYLDKYPIC